MEMPINKEKLYVDVANRIIERIQTEEWTTGMRLPSEKQLAVYFNVSHGTVRDAIRILQREGILHSKAGSGTFVSDSASMFLGTRELASIMQEPEHLRELVQMRYILEPQLAALAARKAKPEEVENLKKIVERMREKNDRASLIAIGYTFHMELVKMAHNRVLEVFYRSAANQLKGMRVLNSLTLEVYLDGINDHQMIAEAVEAHDEQLAEDRMREHLRKDYALYL